MLPESEVIMEYLEERFPEPALWPADAAERRSAASGCSASTTARQRLLRVRRRGGRGRASSTRDSRSSTAALEGTAVAERAGLRRRDTATCRGSIRALDRFERRARRVPRCATGSSASRRDPRSSHRSVDVVAALDVPPLVDAAWVAGAPGRRRPRLGDVRGPNAHQRGHLPGSIPLVLGSPPPGPTARSCGARDRGAAPARRHGVTGDERLVLYDRGDGSARRPRRRQSSSQGIRTSSVLAGGIAAWTGELWPKARSSSRARRP